MVQVRGRG